MIPEASSATRTDLIQSHSPLFIYTAYAWLRRLFLAQAHQARKGHCIQAATFISVPITSERSTEPRYHACAWQGRVGEGQEPIQTEIKRRGGNKGRGGRRRGSQSRRWGRDWWGYEPAQLDERDPVAFERGRRGDFWFLDSNPGVGSFCGWVAYESM